MRVGLHGEAFRRGMQRKDFPARRAFIIVSECCRQRLKMRFETGVTGNETIVQGGGKGESDE